MLAIDELKRLIEAMPQKGKVLDVGCGSCNLYELVKSIRTDIEVYGVDIFNSENLPDEVHFKAVDIDNEPLPHTDNSFDLVVSQHVIEHLRKPVEMFGELGRVAKPNGKVFVEAPSDHSTWFSFPWSQHWRIILSFYDDPTHIGRPWTPQGLYRLGLFWGLSPDKAKYEFSIWKLLFLIPLMLKGWASRNPDIIVETWWQATGWVCFSSFTKPETLEGHMKFSYVSYKGYKPEKN